MLGDFLVAVKISSSREFWNFPVASRTSPPLEKMTYKYLEPSHDLYFLKVNPSKRRPKLQSKQGVFSKASKYIYTPRNLTYQKWPYLKGTIFSKPSFWVPFAISFRMVLVWWILGAGSMDTKWSFLGSSRGEVLGSFFCLEFHIHLLAYLRLALFP